MTNLCQNSNPPPQVSGWRRKIKNFYTIKINIKKRKE